MGHKLAIAGGTPVRAQPWPAWPVWDATDEQELLDTLHSGVWGIGGYRVPEFERRFAGMHQAGYAVACCNGTVAIEIALVAAGIEPGDEVITTAYTFMASALAILAAGAVPVFVDIEPGSHNIDPTLIEQAITDKTAAVLPVHIGGRPADMDGILEVANRRNLKVIEDAAQAWLAAWRGRPVGAIGDAGTFSFQSSKNLSSGEGGLVLTDDEDLFRRAWSYHNCGRTPGGAWYEHAQAGLNYRMTELQAALLLSGLNRLEQQQARRREAMAVLERDLGALRGLKVPDRDARVTGHACHIFMVRLDTDEIPTDKMSVIRALQAEGIPAHPGYTMPLHRQRFFEWFANRPTGAGMPWREVYSRRFADYDLPETEAACDTTIWLKQELLLAGPQEMRDVTAAFDKVLAAARDGSLRGSD